MRHADADVRGIVSERHWTPDQKHEALQSTCDRALRMGSSEHGFF